MRASSWLSTPFPIRFPAGGLVIAALLALMVTATLGDGPVLGAAAAVALGAALLVAGRRSCQRASTRVETILHEELEHGLGEP
jgi:hypothetical protein